MTVQPSARAARPIRAMIVEDSAATRASIASILASARGVEVVLSTADAEEALRRAIQDRPDVVYLDLEMPRMDGFTFLRILMARRPTPVVIVSSSARKQDVFKALELGALDFVAKPESGDVSEIRLELLSRIATVRSLRIEDLAPRPQPAAAAPLRVGRRAWRGPAPVPVPRVIVLGASTGGPAAVARLLALLPADLAVPIAIAQHMPESFTRSFAERLDRGAPFDVREAVDGDLVAPGRVMLAPGGRHLEVVRTPGPMGATLRALVVEPGADDGRMRPSVDVLFASAAAACGREVCAVVLTGMGKDGRAGISAVKRAGGTTLAESEESAVVYGMPKAAVASGDVDEVLPLELLVERIVAFARRP